MLKLIEYQDNSSDKNGRAKLFVVHDSDTKIFYSCRLIGSEFSLYIDDFELPRNYSNRNMLSHEIIEKFVIDVEISISMIQG